MRLLNPYLEFFNSLPPCFRRDPSLPPSAAEMFSPDWLALKAAIARHFSWAVPNDEAIACIGRYARDVVEIGAGSGYWAWLMRQAGLNVAAFDNDPPRFVWTDVQRGDERAWSGRPGSTLFLCWPPWATDMAFNALVHYQGPYFIYVGEWMLGNANARFFQRLVEQYEAVESVAIPQWSARDDHLTVFRRRK